MESGKKMTLSQTLAQAFTVIAVFGGFGFLIWSRLVKRNHPIIHKIQDWTRKPKEKIQSLTESKEWQHPNIERKIY